ncbi:MAG: uracil-DNA glycosylase, partial [Chloroflexi bacterium]|nr:uracil-DNA glycosylase [Chloroflexota bacterium]
MAAEETLSQIANEISACTSCALHEGRKKAVTGEGPANAEIMFIGEGPGFHENEQGRPFVGAAGKFLDQLLAQAGVTRDDVFVA